MEFNTKRESTGTGITNDHLLITSRAHEHSNSSSQPPLMPLQVKFESIASKGKHSSQIDFL